MNLFKKIFPYFLAPLLALIIFCLIFQIWKVDLTIPAFSYGSDGFFSIFIIKNIISSGGFACSDNIGLPHLTERFCIYDFPMQSDMFHMLIVKFFTYFTDNVFLVANLFFITSFMLISATSFAVLRHFKIGMITALSISILYAFAPYHFGRNVWHLFLSNYMIVPLSVMVALWITLDKIKIFDINDKQQYCIRRNKFFIVALLITVFAAGNNIYYSFYSCVIFIFAWLLRALKKSKFFDGGGVEVLILCLSNFLTLFYLYLPTLFYQIQRGLSSYVAGRQTSASESFGLKIIDLFMPVANHYLTYLSNSRMNFNFLVEAMPERASESLGFLGSIGFLFLIIWLIGRNFSQENSLIKRTIKQISLSESQQNLISDLAGINLLIVLFATAGGLVMFISIPFPMLRSHARFAIFIAFISLFLVAIISDKIIQKKLFGKEIYAKIALVMVMILALFDQVGKVSPENVQSQMMKDKYYSDLNFISEIENSLPTKSMIFILPNFGFPENDADDYRSIIAYALSKNLRWSYPVVAGRESFFWQKKVLSGDFKSFIKDIKEAGFVGVYVDRDQYSQENNATKLMGLESNLKVLTKVPALVSKNKKLVFYQI